jgi:hypothetical protein
VLIGRDLPGYTGSCRPRNCEPIKWLSDKKAASSLFSERQDSRPDPDTFPVADRPAGLAKFDSRDYVSGVLRNPLLTRMSIPAYFAENLFAFHKNYS